MLDLQLFCAFHELFPFVVIQFPQQKGSNNGSNFKQNCDVARVSFELDTVEIDRKPEEESVHHGLDDGVGRKVVLVVGGFEHVFDESVEFSTGVVSQLLLQLTLLL